MIYFFCLFFKNNYFRKVMTGTVWAPVTTATPMGLHNQVIRFGKYKKFVCGL